MAVTEKDEELIEYGFVMAFMPGLPQNTETAKKALAAWDQLLALMERENNYSDQLGSNVLDWQIGNWTNDLTMLLHNAGRYKELIKVNEQILQINWKMMVTIIYFMKMQNAISLMHMQIWEILRKHMDSIGNILKKIRCGDGEGLDTIVSLTTMMSCGRK